jgi:NADH dehydrogenase
MRHILIIGGGFGGVWAAAAAVRQRRVHGIPASQLRVTLVDAGDDLVIRPRLYETDPARMRIPLDRILGPIGVHRVAATVTSIDAAAQRVSVLERPGRPAQLPYDRLVLASGSRLVPPRLPGAQHLFNVDTLPAAATLHRHLHRLTDQPDTDGRFTAVVVGAGFTGLELACELTERLRAVAAPVRAAAQVRVVLVERGTTIGRQLGDGARPHIQRALDELGIQVHVGAALTAATPAAVQLSDGTTIPTRTTVWTAGMTASPLTAHIPSTRDHLGRLHVDDFLQVTGVPDVYAAGDTAAAHAEHGHPVTQSCQHAIPLGQTAGRNAAADLLALPPIPFTPAPYVTCLDLGPAGAVYTTGFDRTVRLTGPAAKAIKRTINTTLIYPPVDDAHTILNHADPTTRPIPTGPPPTAATAALDGAAA